MSISKKDINQVFIKWECDENVLVNLMLSASGAVSRMGDGTGDPANTKLCMGHVDEAIFTEWVAALDEAILAWTGRYVMPGSEEKTCMLSLSLSGENLDTGFEFTYGMDADGPPEEIVNLVDFALKLTDDWYSQKLRRR